MVKIWQIIKYEYTRHVFNKRFLLSLLSLPLTVIAMGIVALMVGLFTANRAPIAYIDRSGTLAEPVPFNYEGNLFDPAIEFIPYQEISQAQEDLASEIIQAFYVIPQDFPAVQDVELHYYSMPSSGAQMQFRQFIIQNIGVFEGMDPQIVTRLQEGNSVTVSTLDGSREMRSDQWFLFVMPMLAGVIFIVVVMTSGGYLLQAVVSEKENRTMEIMITSVSPGQLMAGKTIGNISVGLSQLVVWLIFGWLGLLVGAQFWPFLGEISLPANMVLVMFLVFIPAFVMVAAIMSTIGAIMTEMREAQQISGIVSLLAIIPFYVTTPIMTNPNGILAIVLSFFPLTAPITILVRMGYTTIPFVQLALNIFVLVAFAVFTVWLAGRAFRMGMLQYGKKLSLKALFRKYEAV
jgi:ABC-2 type transport system permease protein